MELSVRPEALTFRALEARLLGFVNARIQNGELSERTLAVLLGVSQPQLHNVLKGARTLHTPLADAFLTYFRISIRDLLTSDELQTPHLLVPDRITAGDAGRRLRLLRKQPVSASAGAGSATREAG